jgi:hypothetical protein
MNRHGFEDLLQEVLEGPTRAQCRQNSLAQGMAALRRRKRGRWVRRATTSLAVLTVLFWLLPRPATPVRLATPPTPATPAQTSPGRGSIEEIDDAQLLALFPGQTVALVGPPGEQRLILLGERASVAHASTSDSSTTPSL